MKVEINDKDSQILRKYNKGNGVKRGAVGRKRMGESHEAIITPSKLEIIYQDSQVLRKYY